MSKNRSRKSSRWISRPLAALFLLALVSYPPHFADATEAADSCENVIGSSGGAAAEDILAAQPEEIRETLQANGWSFRHRIVQENQACEQYLTAFVIFDAPRSEVLHLLSQTHRQPEFLRRVNDIIMIFHSDTESIDEHNLRIVFINLNYRVHSSWSYEDWRMSWRLEPGYPNKIRVLRGFWQLYEMPGGRTLAEYATRVNLGRVLPESVQLRLTRRNLGEALEHIRLWVNSGGEYRR